MKGGLNVDLGLLGAVIGITIGTLGGLIGSYFSIKNTEGPKEKEFVIKAVILFWIAGIIFLALIFYIPIPYNTLVWIPYLIALPLVIRYLIRKLEEIKIDEGNL